MITVYAYLSGTNVCKGGLMYKEDSFVYIRGTNIYKGD